MWPFSAGRVIHDLSVIKMAKSSPPSVFCTRLKQGLRNFHQLFLTALAILFSPVLLIVYGFFATYRLLVSRVARYLDPQLGKMVSALSSYFAAHDIYGNSYTTNIALHVVGKVDRMHMIRAMENLLEKNVTPEGESLYVELTQKLVTKFGYKFWKNVDNFSVDQHVTYLNPENPEGTVTLSDIRNLIAKFGKTPLCPDRSPWHIFIVKNFSSSENPAVKSAIILRLHHAMVDGYSVLNIFGKLADNELELAGQAAIQQKIENAYNNSSKAGRFLQAIVKPFVVLFLGSYELVGQLLSYDDNELVQTTRTKFKGIMRFHECPSIPLEQLKAIKNFYRVTMSTLLTTLIVRATKRFMEKRNIHEKKIHMTFPLPVLNHPDKLRNYFSGGIISFDLSHDDPIRLLHAVEQKYNRFRFAFMFGLPEVSMLLLRVIGSLPICLTPRIDNVPLSNTIMHSSFPGPIQTGYFYGFPVVDATVGGSISKPYPTGTLCYSYAGLYKFAVMADASIFTTQEEAKEMGDGIYEEFLNFSRKIMDNVV